MMEFLSIVLLVFGVLQIILFFKLWGMTNDVKKINEKMESEDLAKLIITGENDKAFRILVNSLYEELCNMEKKWKRIRFIEEAGNIVEKYRKLVEETGHKLPEYMSSPEKFFDNITRIRRIEHHIE